MKYNHLSVLQISGIVICASAKAVFGLAGLSLLSFRRNPSSSRWHVMLALPTRTDFCEMTKETSEKTHKTKVGQHLTIQ